MGDYSHEGCQYGTRAISRSVSKRAFSLVGGGDTVAASQLYPQASFSHLCLGGGAMLDYLVSGHNRIVACLASSRSQKGQLEMSYG